MSYDVNRPLNQTELERLIPRLSRELTGHARYAKVMKYCALQRYTKLPERPFVILYETEPNFGHWVAIVDTPEGIEHFDPYGIIPDKELVWVPKWFRGSSGQDVKRLLGMLYHSGKKINYNQYKLQREDTSTCGRWCALRIALSHLTTKQFYNAVKRTMNYYHIEDPDEFVAKVATLYGAPLMIH
jgi:hypothetical protein